MDSAVAFDAVPVAFRGNGCEFPLDPFTGKGAVKDMDEEKLPIGESGGHL